MSLANCPEGLVRMIPPANITDSSLLLSNVPENEYPLYSASVSYATGANVIADHRIYQNNSGGALIGVYPPNNLTQWEDKGPSNRWRMFDLYASTVTENPESIIVELLTSSSMSSLVLLSVSALSIDVRITHPTEGVLFEQSYSMHDSSGITGMYSWLFRKHRKKKTLTLSELPPYRGMTIRVAINAPGGIAKCGSLIVGSQETIGQMQYGASWGITDYSRKEVSSEGVVSIRKGNYSAALELPIVIEKGDFDRVANLAAETRSTPAVWIGGTQYENLTAFGTYKDFRVVIPHSTWHECSLQIEGFIQ